MSFYTYETTYKSLLNAAKNKNAYKNTYFIIMNQKSDTFITKKKKKIFDSLLF